MMDKNLPQEIINLVFCTFHQFTEIEILNDFISKQLLIYEQKELESWEKLVDF